MFLNATFTEKLRLTDDQWKNQPALKSCLSVFWVIFPHGKQTKLFFALFLCFLYNVFVTLFPRFQQNLKFCRSITKEYYRPKHCTKIIWNLLTIWIQIWKRCYFEEKSSKIWCRFLQNRVLYFYKWQSKPYGIKTTSASLKIIK